MRITGNKFILTIFTIILGWGVPTAYSQTWEWQKRQPQTNTLKDIQFINAMTGWCLGNIGMMLKSIDGGDNWVIQDSHTFNNLEALLFVDANIGFAVGDSGTIITTFDGGDSWSVQSTGTNSNLKGVFFVDANTGWTVGSGGMILYTSNGGITWIQQVTGVSISIYDIKFTNDSVGWAAGDDGIILHTNDGGNIWTPQSTGVTSNLRGLSFIHADTGWAIGNFSTLLNTTNGGVTWSLNDSVTSSPFYSFIDVQFLNKTNGWVTSANRIYYTTDGGVNWSVTFVGSLAHIWFNSTNVGWAVGPFGSIYKTTDGGISWVEKSSGAIGGEDIYFLDENIGWSSTNGVVWRTLNGGGLWVPYATGVSAPLKEVMFIDSMTGWATGGGFGTIIKTIDGGVTWIEQYQGALEEYLQSVFFVNYNKGWVVGGTYTGTPILYTSDGGTNWSSQYTDSVNWLSTFNSITFVDSLNGWAVGGSFDSNSGNSIGAIVKTTDGGLSWLKQLSGISSTLQKVTFLDSNNGWAVGMNGTVISTIDGGTTWILQNSGVNNWLNDVFFIDTLNGWIVGNRSVSNYNNGIILRTGDGGVTWIEENPITDSDINGVFFYDSNNGWFSGEAIIKISDATLPCFSNTGIDVVTACDSMTWIDGITYTSSNSTATHVLTNTAGCDSTVSLNLIIDTVNTNLAINVLSGPPILQQLSALQTGATYQWLNCPSMSPISGQTNQTFTITANGGYAVIISNGSCVDTSACASITGVGIIENDFGNELLLYPNPTDGNFSIDLGKSYHTVTITMTDVNGKLIQSKTYNEGQLLKMKLKKPAGVYLLIIESGEKNALIRLVKE